REGRRDRGVAWSAAGYAPPLKRRDSVSRDPEATMRDAALILLSRAVTPWAAGAAEPRAAMAPALAAAPDSHAALRPAGDRRRATARRGGGDWRLEAGGRFRSSSLLRSTRPVRAAPDYRLR